MVEIALLGDRDTALATHRAVDHALGLFPAWARARWVATDSSEAAELDGYDGVWLLPGTPYRDEGAVETAIRSRREHGAPMLGTCGGFQYMALEYARHVAGVTEAAHAEVHPDADATVIAPLACSLLGEQRTILCEAGTRLAQICGTEPFPGFHWCSFGLSEEHLDVLTAAGLVVNARSEDGDVEGIEVPEHPFFLATLFQPQVDVVRSGRLHPLIQALLRASRAHSMT